MKQNKIIQNLIKIIKKSLFTIHYPLVSNGQSLIELSVFGVFIILLLGVLVSYGLKYNFQQQAMQRAFRSSLEIAGSKDIASSSYMLSRDRHIPSPESPYGVGSVSATTSSSGVSMDYKQGYMPSNFAGLPYTEIELQGMVNGKLQKQIVHLKTAGFRKPSSPCTEGSSSCAIQALDDDEELEDSKNLARYQEIYGGSSTMDADNNILMDSCEGQMIGYDACVAQAEQIVDKSICKKRCRRGRILMADEEVEDLMSCEDICNQEIDVPWYAQGGESWTDEHGQKKWRFPYLDSLFTLPDGRKIPAIGLVSDSTQQVKNDLNMAKNEGDSGIVTTDNLNWSTLTTHQVVYNDNLGDKGYAKGGSGERMIEEIPTERAENVTAAAETKWE